jgi:hypothetical protein
MPYHQQASEPQDTAEARSPILIGGCGSSGTTLLRTIINQHPNIFCGPELSTFNKKLLYQESYQKIQQNFKQFLELGIPTTAHLPTEWLPTSVDGHNQREMRFFQNLDQYGINPDQLESIAFQCSTFIQLVDQFFQIVLAKEGKQHWAEKTPTNCYCIKEFFEAFPLGSYIHVVRDGRDVVASLTRRGWSPAAAVRRWMYDTATCIPFRNHPRYFEIHYESFVNNPVAEINRLFLFLKQATITIDPLQILGTGRQGIAGHGSWNLQPGQNISSQATQKWKSDDFPDKKWFEQLFRYTRFTKNTSGYLGLSEILNGNQLLEYFGYDLSSHWDRFPMPGKTLIRHYLREARGRNRPAGLDYLQVSIL